VHLVKYPSNKFLTIIAQIVLQRLRSVAVVAHYGNIFVLQSYLAALDGKNSKESVRGSELSWTAS